MQSLKKAPNLYLLIVSLLGCVSYLVFNHFPAFGESNLAVLCTFVISLIVLNHFMIPISPDGNMLSLDSSVYLAGIYLFGLQFTLYILLFQSILDAMIHSKIEWWKHVYNFSSYCLMIIISNFVYTVCGGNSGTIVSKDFVPYVLSLSVYFIVNTSLISIYFLLSKKESFFSVLKEIFHDKTILVSYINIFLLSFILSILLYNVGLFLGMFLFVATSLIISIAMKKHFEQYRSITDKANKDFLTGLHNHRYFKELLEKEAGRDKENSKPLCISIIDIDNFKQYNDLYGHIQGDHLLQQFGALLKKEAETRNYAAARYGGEEFAFMMPNTDRKQAFAFMNELRIKVNNTDIKGVEALPYGCMSFSAGIAESEKDIDSISQFLNQADQALYSAKKQGKNLVKIFHVRNDYSAQTTHSLDKEIAEAEQHLKIFLLKDMYTYYHSKRVCQYAADFSKKLSLNGIGRRNLILGALFHDIGNMEIPRDILNKKEPLDQYEWEIVKKHVIWSKEMISVNKHWEEVIPIVELHHEHFDGTGYPYQLKEDEIPKLARILCIVDSFDAMTTSRPYQKAKTFEEAFHELRACAGKQFDPHFVELFVDMVKAMDDQSSGLVLNS